MNCLRSAGRDHRALRESDWKREPGCDVLGGEEEDTEAKCPADVV